MGHFRITIEATGCHHNSPRTDVVDGDVEARKLVKKLLGSGFAVHEAKFTMLPRGYWVRSADGTINYDVWSDTEPNPGDIDFLLPDKE